MIIDFDVELQGLDRLERNTMEDAKKVLFLSMSKMEELAKRRCPVDTGQLRRSINLSPRSMGATEYVLADGVDYGVYVEFGTSRMIKAHGIHDPENPLTDWEAKRKRGAVGQTLPFFRPALLEVKRVWMPLYWNQIMTKE